MVFVNLLDEDSIMTYDIATSLNLLIALIKEKKLEETLLDMNVSQWSC
jgi:hypothetical protein